MYNACVCGVFTAHFVVSLYILLPNLHACWLIRQEQLVQSQVTLWCVYNQRDVTPLRCKRHVLQGVLGLPPSCACVQMCSITGQCGGWSLEAGFVSGQAYIRAYIDDTMA